MTGTFPFSRYAELVSASIARRGPTVCAGRWTLSRQAIEAKQVQGDDEAGGVE
jgi:hypothetical protein